MSAAGQLPLLRYTLIGMIAIGLGSFGMIGVGEGLRNIDGPNAVADDYILVLTGIAFAITCLTLLRDLGKEVHRDLQNRFADELMIMKSQAERERKHEPSRLQDAAINVSGLFSTGVTAIVFELARNHGEALADCVAVGGLCGGSQLVPFAALRFSEQRPALRFVACWLSGVMHVFWTCILFGMATWQISLQRTDVSELMIVCGLIGGGTIVTTAAWRWLRQFGAARKLLAVEYRK